MSKYFWIVLVCIPAFSVTHTSKKATTDANGSSEPMGVAQGFIPPPAPVTVASCKNRTAGVEIEKDWGGDLAGKLYIFPITKETENLRCQRTGRISESGEVGVFLCTSNSQGELAEPRFTAVIFQNTVTEIESRWELQRRGLRFVRVKVTRPVTKTISDAEITHSRGTIKVRCQLVDNGEGANH